MTRLSFYTTANSPTKSRSVPKIAHYFDSITFKNNWCAQCWANFYPTANMQLQARSMGLPRALGSCQISSGAIQGLNSRRFMNPSMKRGLKIVTMARVESEILEAGFKAPDFELPEPLTGKTVKLSEYTKDASATLIMVICNHW